jgi:hypothetical protein
MTQVAVSSPLQTVSQLGFSPLPGWERVGVRASVPSAKILIAPHPRLLPPGEKELKKINIVKLNNFNVIALVAPPRANSCPHIFFVNALIYGRF